MCSSEKCQYLPFRNYFLTVSEISWPQIFQNATVSEKKMHDFFVKEFETVFINFFYDFLYYLEYLMNNICMVSVL